MRLYSLICVPLRLFICLRSGGKILPLCLATCATIQSIRPDISNNYNGLFTGVLYPFTHNAIYDDLRRFCMFM